MTDRYGCHDHAPHNGKPGVLMVQDGWTADGRRIMREHWPEWLPIECGHIEKKEKPDTRCDGCRWRYNKTAIIKKIAD